MIMNFYGWVSLIFISYTKPHLFCVSLDRHFETDQSCFKHGMLPPLDYTVLLPLLPPIAILYLAAGRKETL